MNRPSFSLKQTTIDCPDPKVLSDFYVRLLGWEVEYADDNFVRIVASNGISALGFQRCDGYVPPVWPERVGCQQQMQHLDICVPDIADMPEAVEYAIACGAKKAETQFSAGWTVMLDPVGHPFCIDIP